MSIYNSKCLNIYFKHSLLTEEENPLHSLELKMVLPFSRGRGVGLRVVNQYTSVELIPEGD